MADKAGAMANGDVPVVRQVTSADPDTVARIAEVMAEAFNTRDDPMYDALFGGGTVPDFDKFNLVRCKGRVYDAITTKMVFVIEEEGRIAAFATVFPPGVAGSKPASNPYSAELESLTPAPVASLQDHFHHFIDAFEHNAFGSDHYYVCFLATARWARRRGYAAQLLDHVVALAREQGKITSLTTATESNIPYYEKQGFKLVDKSEVKLRGIDLPLWAFIKR